MKSKEEAGNFVPYSLLCLPKPIMSLMLCENRVWISHHDVFQEKIMVHSS